MSLVQPQQTTELWNLTGTHIHLNSSSVGSHSYAQVLGRSVLGFWSVRSY